MPQEKVVFWCHQCLKTQLYLQEQASQLCSNPDCPICNVPMLPYPPDALPVIPSKLLERLLQKSRANQVSFAEELHLFLEDSLRRPH